MFSVCTEKQQEKYAEFICENLVLIEKIRIVSDVIMTVECEGEGAERCTTSRYPCRVVPSYLGLPLLRVDPLICSSLQFDVLQCTRGECSIETEGYSLYIRRQNHNRKLC